MKENLYYDLKKELGEERYEKLHFIIQDLSKKEDKEIYFKYLIEFAKKHQHDNFNERFVYRYLTHKVHYNYEVKIFQQNLKYYMEQKGKNVTDLSNDLSLSYSTVNDWYNGVNYPRPDKIKLLAEYFNISTGDLTELKKHKEASKKVPVLGNIPAGIPIEAIEYIDDYEEIASDWFNSDKQYFALTIKGNSMAPKYETRRRCYI